MDGGDQKIRPNGKLSVDLSLKCDASCVFQHRVDELDKLLTSESNVPDQLASFLAHISIIIKTPVVLELTL